MGDLDRAELDDAQVVRASLTDPGAFAALFDRHAGSVHRYVAKRVGHVDAEDLVGETFATAFRSRPRFDLDRPDARPWLFGIAANLVHRHWRTEGRRRRREGAAPEAVDIGDPAEEASSTVFFQGQAGPIARALGRLDAAHLDVLLLVAGPGFTYEEVAVALDIAVGTVRSRLSRARRLLREQLGASGPYPGDHQVDGAAVGRAAVGRNGGVSMSTELEQVRQFMAGGEPTPDEPPAARAALEEAIAGEGAGSAAEAAAPAVSTRSGPRSSGARRTVRWSAVAAAAQLAHLADVAQPAPVLQPGEWSTYRMEGVVDAHVYTVGKVATPNAEATIPLSVGVWSNATGGTCTSQTFGTATFAAPVNAQAWHAIGLIDAPTGQPATGCVGGEEATWSDSPAVIDVAALTHDPTLLASQLQSGTTGIQSLDQAAGGDEADVAGFVRLTVLLVGPTTGRWSGFGQEMLRTMSLLSGVIGLGERTAHSGRSGPAFTVGEQVTLDPRTGAVAYRWKGPTVIFDGSTGALLEASNFDIPLLQSADQDFVGGPTAPVYTQGVGYGVTTEWMDPVGVPGVVAATSLPGWIADFHIIEAVTLPDTPSWALPAVINPYLGNGNEDASDDGVPTPSQETDDITIIGTQAQVDTVVAALTDSGHFARVTVKL